MVNIKAFVFNPFRENTYFVWDEEGSLVVIDPSFYDQEEQEAFFSLVSRENLTLREIWLTHGHFDQIFSPRPYGRSRCRPSRHCRPVR